MTDLAGNTKAWYQSKTIIVNAIVVAIGIATYITANYTPQSLTALGISPNAANEVLKLSAMIVGLLNVVLRNIQSPTQITTGN